MTRTIYLLSAYDGTEFHGWQRQPALRTVQAVIEDAVRRVVRHPAGLVGCSRTDAGVHASGHASSFTTSSTIEAEKLCHAIGARLPADVAVLAVRDVLQGFHATHSALGKLYRYCIHNHTDRPVPQCRQRYTYHCWHPLDVNMMAEASRHFVGQMDFSALTPVRAVRESMVRRVIRCDVERHCDEVRIDVEGDGFLYQQVRTMVGTLIEVGRGKWPPALVAEILSSRDRRRAGPTAPAHGLCLKWVRYPPELLSPVAAADDAASGAPVLKDVYS